MIEMTSVCYTVFKSLYLDSQRIMSDVISILCSLYMSGYGWMVSPPL